MRYPVYILLFIVLQLLAGCFGHTASAQSILYSTNFGSITNVLPASWTFTGVNMNLSNISPSNSYPGASRGVYLAEGNHKSFRNTSGTLMMTSVPGVSSGTLRFSSIGHTDLELLFGMARNASYPSAVNYQLEWSTDSIHFSPLVFSEPAVATWGLVYVSLPSACNNQSTVFLRWTFNRNSVAGYFKIDDVKVIAHDRCVAPSILIQPVSPPPSCIGSAVMSFQVIPDGTGPFTYQWQEDSVTISDGIYFSGTQTSKLDVLFPHFGFNGKHYRCVITNCSGAVVTTDNQANLQLTTLTGDFNFDGSVTNSDFVDFLSFWQNPCSCVYDLNNDGIVDLLDYLLLVGNFNKACSNTN